MESLYCIKLADGRLVFFDTMETAIDSVKLTYHSRPGKVDVRYTNCGAEVIFVTPHGGREWVCLIINVLGWSTIHTTPQHL
jgi:hypothetical protein